MMKIIFKRDTSIYSIHRISLELINIGRLIPLYIRLFIYIKLANIMVKHENTCDQIKDIMDESEKLKEFAERISANI